jgi:predicted DNA-binding transcriptional regulator AlpA
VPTICALYAIGPATAWRWSAAGRLPTPKKVGPRVSAWNVGELRAARKQAA